MYALENMKGEVFAGYGPTTAQPLFCAWSSVTQVILFRTLADADNVVSTLDRVWDIGAVVREL
jgi:hypothetical protein